MKCPHCNEGIHPSFARTGPVHAGGLWWTLAYLTCPECTRAVLHLGKANSNASNASTTDFPAYPQNATRPVPLEVPDPYRQDFIEAWLVLPLSPKASAALSRRNVQAIIRDKEGVKGQNLTAEIQTVIDSGKVPSFVTEGLHAVRQIGNFAAHPIKSTSTGEIVDVEEGEAEWNLEVLESLFDFYFVQPALTSKRKVEMNKKLGDAGKPLLT
jgi:hypothetical protein